MDTIIVSITCTDPSLLPEGDLSGILAALSESGLSPIYDIEADVMQEWQRANFASEGGVFGDGWAALSPVTIAQKERQGFTSAPLIREGHLQAAIGETTELNGSNVTTGIDLGEVPYAAFQQVQVRNKPGRILVAATAGEAQEIESKVHAYLDEALGAAAQAFQITVELV